MPQKAQKANEALLAQLELAGTCDYERQAHARNAERLSVGFGLALPAAEKVAEKARAAGENVTSRDMLPEVPAYIAGGQWERVGLTLDGAVDVLYRPGT